MSESDDVCKYTFKSLVSPKCRRTIQASQEKSDTMVDERGHNHRRLRSSTILLLRKLIIIDDKKFRQ